MNNRKKPKREEPANLRRGKAFHKQTQEDWVQNAEGHVVPEKSATKPSGRKGRIDNWSNFPGKTAQC
ncbi:MAG: hypothetical protein ACYCXL_09625 [Thermoleophilia bacterium]